jgi:hypothetical protein
MTCELMIELLFNFIWSAVSSFQYNLKKLY